MRNYRRTVNIYVGRKLSGKSRDEILEAILQKFAVVVAVQQSFDVIRVTFETEADAVQALEARGVYLFGNWCRMDGGPPTTIVHVFDFPFQEMEEHVRTVFSRYGVVKSVRNQKYISRPGVFTGTRLVDIIFDDPPPREVMILGFPCRVWYKGQPVVCNICNKEGHKSVACPDKDKCRLCKQAGHFARDCPAPWGINREHHAEGAGGGQASGEGGDDVAPPPRVTRVDVDADPAASGSADNVASERGGGGVSSPPVEDRMEEDPVASEGVSHEVSMDVEAPAASGVPLLEGGAVSPVSGRERVTVRSLQGDKAEIFPSPEIEVGEFSSPFEDSPDDIDDFTSVSGAEHGAASSGAPVLDGVLEASDGDASPAEVFPDKQLSGESNDAARVDEAELLSSEEALLEVCEDLFHDASDGSESEGDTSSPSILRNVGADVIAEGFSQDAQRLPDSAENIISSGTKRKLVSPEVEAGLVRLSRAKPDASKKKRPGSHSNLPAVVPNRPQ